MKTYKVEILLSYERELNASEIATVGEIIKRHMHSWDGLDGLALFETPELGIGDTKWPRVEISIRA